MIEGAEKNYILILKKLADYLLSRVLIIINSLIIIPFFAHIMSSKQMSVYQIAVETLNLVCTCSFDWVSKAALRFYQKFKIKNKLDEFLSTLIFIGILVYLITLVAAFVFRDKYCAMFSVPPSVFYITLFLLIPCGIRQFLYQILRVLNRHKLYNFSILFYQFALLFLFLTLINFTGKLTSVLLAMCAGMVIIDVYIMKQIELNYKITFLPDNSIVKEVLKYSLPTIATNIAIWAVLNINKFIFQNHNMFLQTAVAGMSWMLGNSIIKPFLTLFLFAVFPLIINRYELNKDIKPFFTNTIQLYCALFIPALSALCYYSDVLVKLFLPENYSQAGVIFPFFIISIFLHEFMKLINVKYHLKNKTYIEMCITLFIGLISIYLNIKLIPHFGLIAAGAVMLFSVVGLITLNTLVNFKSLNYIDIKKILKTLFSLILIGFASFILVNILTVKVTGIFEIIKIFLYIIISYGITWSSRKFILH